MLLIIEAVFNGAGPILYNHLFVQELCYCYHISIQLYGTNSSTTVLYCNAIQLDSIFYSILFSIRSRTNHTSRCCGSIVFEDMAVTISSNG